MILSVSRRTDIPNYYADWFYNRIREGFVYVRNPMNAHQISRIDLSREVVDCIVFWTKNPKPMMDRLDELAAYHYYFQFTLTGYGNNMEPNVPHKKEVMIPVFQELSERIGKQSVVWRYDPIFFTEKYTPEYHLKAFGQIAEALGGYTEKCVISFLDMYAKTRRNMQSAGLYEIEKEELAEFAGRLAGLASKNGMKIGSCAESIDLEAFGIPHNCCIDRELIEKITGCKIRAEKDKNQRPECGCVESVDIGAYHTCRNGCLYCYANESEKRVIANNSGYDPQSPILCGVTGENDKITERRVKSLIK